MAKQSTKCDVCGGNYDGTPSGLKKHNATGKHALAARMADKVGTGGPAGKSLAAALTDDYSGSDGDAAQAEALAEVEAPEPTRRPLDPNGTFSELGALIIKREGDLTRRKRSLTWVQNNNPTDADRYAEEKVDPILRELDTLKDAERLLWEAYISPNAKSAK
jgi:hypothetical protein